MSSFRRRQMLAAVTSTPQPYDAIVEYVDGNGTYVNTNFVLFDHTVITEMQMSEGYKNNVSFFGLWRSKTNTLFMLGLYQNKYYFGVESGEKNVNPVQPFDTDWHTYIVSGRGLLQVDSDVLYNTPKAAVDCVLPAAIFNRPYYNTRDVHEQVYDALFPAGLRCRSFKIIDNTTDNVVFDAIPVRIGTVGYLYDQVGGSLLGGVDGDLVPGNDI